MTEKFALIKNVVYSENSGGEEGYIVVGQALHTKAHFHQGSCGN